MPEPVPIVLIEIDENSRLNVRQTTGVRIGFIDYRVEKDALTFLPEQDQEQEIMAAIGGLSLISPKSDDAVQTAAATIMRIGSKQMIVARGPQCR
jgi:hypothetical protein